MGVYMLNRMDPTRRTFLVGLGRYAAAAQVATALPAWMLADTANAAVAPVCPPRSAWTDLGSQLLRQDSGQLVMPGDPFFGDYFRPNNARYAGQVPQGIVRCADPTAVQAAISFVKAQGLPFAIRSGGHNYAGFCTTRGLLIDMTPMAGATLAPFSSDLVDIRGGSINSALYQSMERLGRTITHGRCDSVGAAGFILGGGIGFDMRLYGMASDLLQSTQLVTADGDLVTVDAKHGADLFWACRGGAGGNFGVNTGFTMRTFPVSNVTVFRLEWVDGIEKVLHALLQQLAAAPDEFGSKISVTMPSRQDLCSGIKEKMQIRVSLLGQLHPSRTALRDIIGTSWGTAEQRVVHAGIPYWEGAGFLAETTYPYYYQEKSSFMKAANITERAVATMFRLAREMPATSMETSFKFFQVGGAVNRTPATETAYVHRGYDWLFSVEANWWEPTDGPEVVNGILDWQRRFYAEVNRETKAQGAFQNFPDPTLENWQQAYYGENLNRLSRVKAQVDPNRLFTFAQAIPSA